MVIIKKFTKFKVKHLQQSPSLLKFPCRPRLKFYTNFMIMWCASVTPNSPIKIRLVTSFSSYYEKSCCESLKKTPNKNL